MTKDFSNANTGRVYDTIAEATAEPEQTRKPRKEYTDDDRAAFMAAGTTTGRKGCKAVRINMAFPPDLHDYIRIMARVRGQTITEFTNDVIRASMETNAETYEQAKAFRAAF